MYTPKTKSLESKIVLHSNKQVRAMEGLSQQTWFYLQINFSLVKIHKPKKHKAENEVSFTLNDFYYKQKQNLPTTTTVTKNKP